MRHLASILVSKNNSSKECRDYINKIKEGRFLTVLNDREQNLKNYPDNKKKEVKKMAA